MRCNTTILVVLLGLLLATISPIAGRSTGGRHDGGGYNEIDFDSGT